MKTYIVYVKDDNYPVVIEAEDEEDALMRAREGEGNYSHCSQVDKNIVFDPCAQDAAVEWVLSKKHTFADGLYKYAVKVENGIYTVVGWERDSLTWDLGADYPLCKTVSELRSLIMSLYYDDGALCDNKELRDMLLQDTCLPKESE